MSSSSMPPPDPPPPQTRENRVVLITGAAAGLGLAMARRFAAQGYAVAGLDRDAITLEAALAELAATGAKVLGLTASVTDEDAVEAALDRCMTQWGRLDVLINNAGLSCHRPALDLSLDDWRRALDVNLTGAFLCARAAARRMIGQGGGVVLNIGSMYGTVAAPDRGGYCAPKAALDMLSRVLALEWAPHAIRVNTIAPGYVRTALLEDLIQQGRVDAQALTRRTPLGRFGTPGDVAELALFLASDHSGFITGQTIGVDGGWTANGYL